MREYFSRNIACYEMGISDRHDDVDSPPCYIHNRSQDEWPLKNVWLGVTWSSSSGFLVETKSGKKGRTYHNKGLINGKVPVYVDGEEKPILCDPTTLKQIGFID